MIAAWTGVNTTGLRIGASGGNGGGAGLLNAGVESRRSIVRRRLETMLPFQRIPPHTNSNFEPGSALSLLTLGVLAACL